MSVIELSRQQNETDAVEPGEAESMVASELHERCWSVISFERCEAGGLTYSEAMAKLEELELSRIAGLCIVTNDVATRVKTPK